MGCQLTRDAYEKLIEEDIQWLLDNTERTLERSHIIDVLNGSADRYYGKKDDMSDGWPENELIKETDTSK